MTNFASLPVDLRETPHWVVWKETLREGKLTKPPIDPSTGRMTDATNPLAWMTFAEARGMAPERGDGIGFAFGDGTDDLVGIDLDKCLNEAGGLEDWAFKIVRRFNSYTEISPSGNGLHIWIRGILPSKHNRKGPIEIYTSGRYFTVTGNHWPDTPQAIATRQDALDELYRELWPEPANHQGNGQHRASIPVDDSDEALLAHGRKHFPNFEALFDRGDDIHGDKSGSDLALLNQLAYLTGRDAGRMEALFSASALGSREKWDRPDYRQRSIAKAIDGCDRVYEPRSSRAYSSPVVSPVSPVFNRTDLGNAERFTASHRAVVRYCHPRLKWLAWDFGHWKLDDTAAVGRLAESTVRKILHEAAGIDDPKKRKAMADWSFTSESKTRIDAMLTLASRMEGIPILPDEMDRDPWLFNCMNGTLDLRTGKLRDHDPADLITKLCPVKYDPEAKCPCWEGTLIKFLVEPALIDYLRRLLGYCLTGDTREQILPILHGNGANGKSTILNAILQVMGSDYAMKAPPALLMAKKNDSHPTELAALFGKRLVVAIETAEGRRLSEVVVKELTGGDRITARRMREDFWEFTPTHKLIMATNHKPEIRGTDHAIWRRIKEIPFIVKVEDDHADKTMPDKLKAEFPGILAWMVRGCLEWRGIGLAEPQAVKTATSGYRAESDLVGAFLQETTTPVQGARVRCRALYDKYREWAESANLDRLNMTRFGYSMKERGIRKTTYDPMCYIDIGLRNNHE